MLKRDVLARTVVLLLGAGLCTSIVSADIINVPAGGDIQAAINAASDGDEIQLEAGDYYPSATILLDKAITLRGATDGEGNPTSTIDGQGLMRVLQCFSVSAGTVFENLLITGGNTADYGGGMFNYNSSPTLTGCTFTNNSTDNDGGGMFNYNSSPTLNGCTFTSNSASNGGGMLNDNNSSPTLINCTFTGNVGDGGGMYNYNSSPVLEQCSFSNNTTGSFGGGMHNSGTSGPSLTDCQFIQNSASEDGGGIRHGGFGTVTLVNCTFEGNVGKTGGGFGSGFFFMSGPAILKYCTFKDNTAKYWGGGISYGDGALSVENCTFEGNTAVTNGGGIYISSTSPTLTDCTFTNNLAESGGGLYSSSGSPELTGCVFEGNSADVYGGGMASDTVLGQSGSPLLTGCTFTNNSANSAGGFFCRDSTLTNCTFENNSAIADGGGMNCKGNSTLGNCTFENNSAQEKGGGVHCSNNVAGTTTSLTIGNCTYVGNTSKDGGAIYTNENGVINDCTFRENQAYFGGALSFAYGYTKYFTINDCRFNFNKAIDLDETDEDGPVGGAVYIAIPSEGGGATPHFVNCWFEGNQAITTDPENPSKAGAVYYLDYSLDQQAGNVHFDTCTLKSNLASDGSAILNDSEPGHPYPSCVSLFDCHLCDNGTGAGIAGLMCENSTYDDECLETDCPGDFNNDGVVDGGDFGNLLVAWGSCPGCPQDLNGDNAVNGADVGLILSYWGPCPEDYNCNVPHDGPGCNDAVCQEIVCELDRLCCDANFDWDQTCAAVAAANCP